MPTPRSRYALALALILVLPLPFGRASDAPGPGAATHYQDALAHESAGRAAEAAAAYERVLAADPEHRAARRALGYEEVDGYWHRGDALQRARGFVRHGGRWLTAAEFAAATRPTRDTEAQIRAESQVWQTLAAIAAEDESRAPAAIRALETFPPEHLLPPLAKALRCEPPSLRVRVAERLGRLGDPLAVPALLRRTIYDSEVAVRHAAADALRAIGVRDVVHPLGRALWSRDADVRVRAAEALGRSGRVEAAAYLIARWENRSGDFTRVYFAQSRQIAFIQDFDVEVASTSFIADPLVGVLQAGILQDVRVLATEATHTSVERVAVHEALVKTSGEDHGDDVRAWRTWWDGRSLR